MWTGIIAIAAFCMGFLMASLLACGKAADAEFERIRRSMSLRKDADSTAETSGPGVGRVTPSFQARPAHNQVHEGMTESGLVPAVKGLRRVEAT